MECNRFVAYWETQRNWDIHEKKLKNMQPVLNTTTISSPRKEKPKCRNPKYDMRQFEIDLENKALLAKITKKEWSPNQTKTTFKDSKIKKVFKNRYFEEYDK